MNCREMCSQFEGEIALSEDEVNLDVTLLGGQSFRWRKVTSTTKPHQWCGVAANAYWILTQKANVIAYKAFVARTQNQNKPNVITNDTSDCQMWLQRYFRTDFDLRTNLELWKKAHNHFASIAPRIKTVRVLRQEPVENILSFICSQNNHIKRISSMIDWLCSNYGEKIGTFFGRDEYAFPSLAALSQHQPKMEEELRAAKFGYRAKFISQAVAKINEYGGDDWFNQLSKMSYKDARTELVTLPGIGFKVADCICLMSLGHLEAVPIDTHLYKIAQSAYLPHLAKVKSITPRIYDEIAIKFRCIYGPYSGWAQAVLFCSDLPQFQLDETNKLELEKNSLAKRNRKN